VVGAEGQPLPTKPAPATGAQPGTPAKPGAAEAPAPAAEEKLGPDRIHLEADKTFMTEKAVAGEGHVIIKTDEYTLHADTVEIDRESNVAWLRGHVVIEGNNLRTEGEALWIDLDSEAWRMERAAAKVEPQFFTEGVEEPLYVRGRQADYDPQTDTVKVAGGEGTSCDQPKPHYDLRTPKITLRPGDMVTFEKPSLYLLGHRLFRYPFNLTMSLKQREQNIVPEIGTNDIEGNYMKFAFLYLLGAGSNGVARLHLTQKRGIGLGFDHVFESERHEMDLSLFDEPSQGALSARVSDTFRFNRRLTSDFNTSYQADSGFSFSSSSLSSDLTFRNTDVGSDTTLGFSRSLTGSDFGSSGRFGSTLTHNQRLGRRTSWNLRSSYTRATFAGATTDDEELAEEFELRHQANAFDMDFAMSNRSDLSQSTTGGFYALNRLPFLSFETDSRRLGGWRAFGRANTRLRMELGHYSQSPTGDRVSRVAFRADLGGGEYGLGDRMRARTAVRLRQSFYDDGSAQYNMAFDGELRRRLTDTWQTRLMYGYAATRGVSPLRLDFGGQSNEARWQFVRLVPDRSRFEVSSGFDFISNQFYDVRMLMEVRPSEHFYLRAQSAYSLQQARWWPLVVKLTQASGSSYADLTFNYDIAEGRLSTITADTDFRFWRWWRLEFVGSYSGFSHQIDQADVRLTRDLHCLLAQVTYSTYPREVNFSIGIKAFPGLERVLGIGANGGYLPSSPGSIY
jgi:lipopolysaccharide export system protein LptA